MECRDEQERFTVRETYLSIKDFTAIAYDAAKFIVADATDYVHNTLRSNNDDANTV